MSDWGELGKWAFAVCKDPAELPGMLSRLAAAR